MQYSPIHPNLTGSCCATYNPEYIDGKKVNNPKCELGFNSKVAHNGLFSNNDCLCQICAKWGSNSCGNWVAIFSQYIIDGLGCEVACLHETGINEDIGYDISNHRQQMCMK